MTGQNIVGVILLLTVFTYVTANPITGCPAGKAPVCPQQDPRMAILVPHSTSCEWYYECSNGIAYCMPCPAGEYFNPKLKVCDYPENAGCGSLSASNDETEAGNSNEDGSSEGSEDKTEEKSENISKTNPETANAGAYGCPTVTPPPCPSEDGKTATLLPHPSSNSFYYECSNGNTYCMPCPAGLVFNPNLNVCDYTVNGKVSETEKDSETVIQTDTNTVSKTINSRAFDCPAATAPSCPSKDGRTATLLPHPSSASFYYECSNGIAYCMPCPSELVFNTNLNVCDYAVSGKISETDKISEKVIKTDTKTVNTGSSNCPAATAPSCPSKDGRTATLLPHPSSASFYYECSNGIAYCMPCPSGLVFNTNLNVCDYAVSGKVFETDKSSEKIIKTDTKTVNKGSSNCPAATAPSCPSKDGKTATLLPHPSSASFYYECSNGIAYCMPCPAGLVFNNHNKVCDYAVSGTGSDGDSGSASISESEPESHSGSRSESVLENGSEGRSSCPAASGVSCPSQDPKMAVLLAHPASCEWYFECSNGTPYCMPCPAGEYFNDELKVCDYKEHSGCRI